MSSEETLQSLSDAWDAAESGEADVQSTEPTSVVEEDSSYDTEVVAEAEHGGNVEEGESAERSGRRSTTTDPASPAAGAGADAVSAAQEVPDEKPPVSLSAAAREAWNETPPAMRAEIKKREADFARGIQKYAESAKRASAMDKTLAPYSQYFQMNGGAPKAINEALQTAALLQMGSPIQKAQATAQLIKQFGVDISALDNLLVGEAPPPEAQQAHQLEQMLQQRLAPYQQQMQQFQQMQQMQVQQAQQSVNSEIDNFAADPAHEFYHDVRADMADILDMAANRGQTLSLQDAYDRAVAMNPELQRIVQSRQQKQALQSKRKAASSVAGAPGGAPGGRAEGGLRSTLLDAWEGAGRT